MRRTLLAVALAVLVSTFLAPHHDHWSALDGVRWKERHEAYYTKGTRNKFDPHEIFVDVVGYGGFVFPRGMTTDEIQNALRKSFPEEEIVLMPANPKDQVLQATGKHSPFVPTRTTAPWPYEQFAWVEIYHPAGDFYYQPDWVDAWKWYPAFWPAKSLLLTPFIAQTLFLATLAVVLVNLRQKKSR